MFFKVEVEVRKNTDGSVDYAEDTVPLEALDDEITVGDVILSRGGVNNKTIAVRLTDQPLAVARVIEPSLDAKAMAPDGCYTEWMDLGRAEVRIFIDQVADPSENRGRGKGSRICANCWHFSREEGRRMLTEMTHKYENGSYSFPRVVANALADRAKSSPLTPGNVGYCAQGPKGRTLLHHHAPACKNFDPVPRAQQLANKLRLLFAS